jgi:hypothetical protein
MALTAAELITNFDTFIGDSSTDRISQAERFQYLTQATSWLQEELGNEHMVDSYTLNYLDGIHRYKITSAVADLLVGADLLRGEEDHDESATRKSAREMNEEIGQDSSEFSWAIDRYDGDSYLLVNLNGKFARKLIGSFNSLTADGGTWTADTTGSDALTVTQDITEKKQGSASLNFDVDVSQSVGNLATIYNDTGLSKDLSDEEDLGSFTLWVYVPDVTEFSSVTLTWSSDTSGTPSGITNYWAATVTTDINGSAFADGWNQVKINWVDATKTASPDSSAILYYQIDLNYTASQGDDTDFRLDELALANPEKLTYKYISWNVGKSTGGSDITAYTATTDVPFFSGRYDQYKYAVAHKAASLCFYSSLRLENQGAIQESEALKALERYIQNFEGSRVREMKNFKIKGVNLRSRRTRSLRRR